MSRRAALAVVGLGLLLVSALFLMFALVSGDPGLNTTVSEIGAVRSPGGSDDVTTLTLESVWPQEIDISSSDSVQVALIVDDEVSSSGTTIEVPLEGEYEIQSAIVTLAAANFEVSPSETVEQSFRGRDPLQFVWNIAPEKAGDQNVTLTVTPTLIPADGSEPFSPVLDGGRLNIKVTEPGGLSEYLKSVPAVILSLLTALIGSALSVPFYYNLWKERAGQAQPSG